MALSRSWKERMLSKKAASMASAKAWKQIKINELTFESWFTKLEYTPLNWSQQLPAPYRRIIHEGPEQNW